MVDLHTNLDEGLPAGNVLKPHPRGKYATTYERIMANVEQPKNELACWHWLGRLNTRNYPQMNMRVDGKHKTVLVHRVMAKLVCGFDELAEQFGGDVEVDHICHNTTCLNPDHLHVLPRLLNQNAKRG
jgi:hypothetical protein